MALMKAGLYFGEKHVAPGELEIPKPREGEALIRVSSAGICGTDMLIYYGKHPRAQAPLAMCHEFSGVIVETVGDSPFAPGDHVVPETYKSCGSCEACLSGQYHVCKTLRAIGIDSHGGFAEFAVVPLNKLHRIPEGLSDNDASMTEPLAVAVHTVRRSGMKLGSRIAILGGGPIGLLIGLVAKQAGAQEIIISDVSPYRIQKAKELGFTALDAKTVNVTEEILSVTGGIGADVIFEVAGNQATVNQMVEATRIQGNIVVVSLFKQLPTVDLTKMHFKELSLTTTRCYSRNDFETALHLMSSGKVDVAPLISHELALDQIAEGFRLMENPEVAMKIVFRPSMEGSE